MKSNKSKPIYKPELEKRIDKRKALIDERNKLLDDAYKIKIRVEEIGVELAKGEPELEITDHAVERFKERIQGLSNSAIRKLLNDKEVIKKYKKYGEGRYKLGSNSDIIAVVSNWKVVTCYSKSDWRDKEKDLIKYMDYYIDELVNQVQTGRKYKIDSFGKFRRRLFR